MNTLVDPHDGAPGAPETKDEVTCHGPSDAAAGGAATLIELAPAAGQTLILSDGPAPEVRQALAATATVAKAPARPASSGRAQPPVARAHALRALQNRARLKRLAPYAVGVASLLATAIPLWSRSPRPADSAATMENPLPADPPPAPAAAAEQPVTAPFPALSAGAPSAKEESLRERPRAAAARALGARRRRASGAVAASRWKGHAQVLRTRNGAPVVD
jgi:hypothetical protein